MNCFFFFQINFPEKEILYALLEFHENKKDDKTKSLSPSGLLKLLKMYPKEVLEQTVVLLSQKAFKQPL